MTTDVIRTHIAMKENVIVVLGMLVTADIAKKSTVTDPDIAVPAPIVIETPSVMMMRDVFVSQVS